MAGYTTGPRADAGFGDHVPPGRGGPDMPDLESITRNGTDAGQARDARARQRTRTPTGETAPAGRPRTHAIGIIGASSVDREGTAR